MRKAIKEEVKQSIAESIPDLMKEILKGSKENTKLLENNMKISFAQVVKEQQAESTAIPSTWSKNDLKEVITQSKNEEEKLEKRKRNIIIFNAKEIGNTETEIKESDLKLFQNMCNHADKSILRQSDEITGIRRLGTGNSKKADTGTTTDAIRSRPILVSLKSEHSIKKLFFNFHRVKQIDGMDNLNISHDRTEEEKKATTERLQEAKQKNYEIQNNNLLNEEEKNWVFRVRGPPWNQKIVKVAKR